MNILLKGHRNRFEELCLCVSQSENHSITYMEAADTTPIGSLSKTGLYDWIIVDGHMHKPRIMAAVDNADSLPDNYCSSQTTVHSACGITRSKNGVLQLHCGRHQLLTQENHPAQQKKHLNSDGYAFEFQAPCKER